MYTIAISCFMMRHSWSPQQMRIYRPDGVQMIGRGEQGARHFSLLLLPPNCVAYTSFAGISKIINHPKALWAL